MKEGFSKVASDPVGLSLKKQITRFCQLALKTKEKKFYLFSTSKKRLKYLAKAAHSLAQEYPQLFFLVNPFNEDSSSSTLGIVRKEVGKEGLSYTWVEKSTITNKWLVQVMPPGARRARCLTVYQDEERAKAMAFELEPLIASMPLTDWRSRKNTYQELLESLPEDDDGIIGQLNLETGELVYTDREVYEATSEILKNTSSPEADSESIRARLSEYII